MTHFELYDEFRVEVRGDGSVADYLRETFAQFEVPDDGLKPDVIVSVDPNRPTPETVLGGPDVHFGVEGDRFVIQEGPHHMAIDRDWRHIRTSPENIHHHIAYLVEFEVRKRLAEEGRAIVHAAGARTRGETLLFPAWRSAGKTNTMLSFVTDGADYLSDDRVWVDRDGSVEEYPIPINVLARNDGMIGFDPDLTRGQRLRRDVSEFILDRVDMQRSLLDKLVSFFTQQFISLDVRYRLLSIEDLVPTAEHVRESTADRMIFLRARPHGQDDEVTVEPISREDALSALRTISYWEWNRRLRDYFGAFDMLFSGADRLAELEALLDAEERIFEELLEDVDPYRAHIPREKDWIGTGIVDQIREKLPSHSSAVEVPTTETR